MTSLINTPRPKHFDAGYALNLTCLTLPNETSTFYVADPSRAHGPHPQPPSGLVNRAREFNAKNEVRIVSREEIYGIVKAITGTTHIAPSRWYPNRSDIDDRILMEHTGDVYILRVLPDADTILKRIRRSKKSDRNLRTAA